MEKPCLETPPPKLESGVNKASRIVECDNEFSLKTNMKQPGCVLLDKEKQSKIDENRGFDHETTVKSRDKLGWTKQRENGN